MSGKRWFRLLLAGTAAWALLQGCGSDGAGPVADGMDGGNGASPDGHAGEATSSRAGKAASGAEGGMASAGMSAAGQEQGGAPVLPGSSRVWVGAAVGEGQGASHRARIRLGGPQSGRGDSVTVHVKVGRP